MTSQSSLLNSNEDKKLISGSGSAEPLTVAQLNAKIRGLIETEIGTVWVRGEISNFKAHTSGHYYFSLKDSDSAISAVMFRGLNSRLKFKLTDGMEVIARGKISVYEPRGSYQIICDMLEPVGAGALQKAFEQLKEKLKAEGLFEASRKRPIPQMPRHIAIVTSATGAAIRDMIQVLTRRNRLAQITLVPAAVQGAAAVPELLVAMKKAFLLPQLDVIIIGRGGGSLEDLWAFNNEELARVIATSPVPVISAVGHEIDFTIADFVADLRAPTPSAAAELVMRGTDEILQQILRAQQMLRISVGKRLQIFKQRVENFSSRLQDPKRKLQDLVIHQDELNSRLLMSMSRLLENKKLMLLANQGRLVRPNELIANAKARVQNLNKQIVYLVEQKVLKVQLELKNEMALLDAVSPLKVLERGFSIATQNGDVLLDAKNIKLSDPILIRLNKGEVTVRALEIKEGK